MHARVLKQITVVCCVMAAVIKMTTQYVRLPFSETSTKRCEEFGDEKDVSPMYIYPMSNVHWIVQHQNEHSPNCIMTTVTTNEGNRSLSVVTPQ